MKCINCGAPMSGNRCEYCGTEYTDRIMRADFPEDELYGTLYYGGMEYKCYVGEVRRERVGTIDYRTVKTPVERLDIYKHKFTLIEV